MSPWGQVHGEIDVPAQRLEPSGVEPADSSNVAGHRADGQVFVTTVESLLDNPADEPPPDAPIPGSLGHDDRLDFPARTSVEQTSQTDDPGVRLGHPGSDPLRHSEVTIESRSRVVAADRRVPVDTSVVLRQLCPQRPAGAVVAFGVVAHDDLRRSWRAWLPRNRHLPNGARRLSRRHGLSPGRVIAPVQETAGQYLPEAKQEDRTTICVMALRLP